MQAQAMLKQNSWRVLGSTGHWGDGGGFKNKTPIRYLELSGYKY